MMYRTAVMTEQFDLNTVCRGDGFLFVRDGIGVAGRGIVCQVSEQEALTFLQTITPSQSSVSEHGPILFSLVPFSPSRDAEFLLPRIMFRKSETGDQFVTLIGESDDELSDEVLSIAVSQAIKSTPPRPQSNSYRVTPRTAVGHYLDAVGKTRDAVRAGVIQKAVIARDIEVLADDPIDVHAILLRLRASFGSSYRYCVNNIIGASPELLVSVHDSTVRSHPLAGTAPRTGDTATDKRLADELVASTKNQTEHRIVIDMVHDTLLPYCSYLDWEAEPSIVTVANVQHLGTAIEGALTEPRAHVFSLVRALCPTPALGGHPSEAALAFIDSNEGLDRGYYGGAVGYMDTQGNGVFAVTIRCAEMSDDKRTARLFAGGGIVADSDPYAELAETQAKFQAMLSAIIRP
ncbi:MAG: isochorismate synthase [Actinomycetota bacterium]